MIDFSKFKCSEPILDAYLHERAVEDMQRDICTLYLLVNAEKDVGGYFVISSSSIRRENLPTAKHRKNLPGYPLGSFHIGRLARHETFVSEQIGSRLIKAALKVAVDASSLVKAHVITVDAKNARAKEFYASFGFLDLTLERKDLYPCPMFIKLSEAILAIT